MNPLASLGALLSFFVQGFFAKRVQEAAKRSLGLDLGRVWRGFGKGLEGLGVSWATFLRLFSRLCCQEGSRGSKRRPRGLLGSISEGFRRVLGRVWEAKMVKISRFLVFFGCAFRDFNFDRILFDF